MDSTCKALLRKIIAHFQTLEYPHKTRGEGNGISGVSPIATSYVRTYVNLKKPNVSIENSNDMPFFLKRKCSSCIYEIDLFFLPFYCSLYLQSRIGSNVLFLLILYSMLIHMK